MEHFSTAVWPWTLTLTSEKLTGKFGKDAKDMGEISWKSDLHFSGNHNKRMKTPTTTPLPPRAGNDEIFQIVQTGFLSPSLPLPQNPSAISRLRSSTPQPTNKKVWTTKFAPNKYQSPLQPKLDPNSTRTFIFKMTAWIMLVKKTHKHVLKKQIKHKYLCFYYALCKYCYIVFICTCFFIVFLSGLATQPQVSNIVYEWSCVNRVRRSESVSGRPQQGGHPMWRQCWRYMSSQVHTHGTTNTLKVLTAPSSLNQFT